MNYYRITLADGTYHYLTGSTARSVRRRFTREYPHLGGVASVRQRL
jgi:hypothetical protein